MHSFVFSLTNGDKFVQDSHIALRYYPEYGPMFGNSNGTDFSIVDQGNKHKKCICNINNGYYNSKYNKNDSVSWENFYGEKDNHYFCVKDWEVWGIEFE